MLKRLAAALLVLTMSAVTAAPLTAAAAQQTSPSTPSLTVPIVGSGPGGTFNGAFQLQRFVNQNGTVVATGLLTGTLTTAAGVVTSIVRTITLPVALADPTCEILHLDLGPLSLDLLGLQVDLSRVVLDITAQAGAGNLLGNLLCAVAGLLDNPSGLARLLNQILGALLG
jgi:hypothetical protein